MSTPKITRAVQTLFKQISRMAHTLTKGMISWLLRGLLIVSRKSARSTAGFVLPTTVLLLLVVTLTVGAIGFRTYTRSQQAIGERQQRVIYNAATPAVDRAKSKLEFLFNGNRDRRFSGVPGEERLLGMMLNDGTNGEPHFPANNASLDPYTFPGENRIDLNNDGKKDNAWIYTTEPDASGKRNRIVYSILFTSPTPQLELRDSTKAAIQDRAKQLQIRNAPLSNNNQIDPACVRNTGNNKDTEEDGWFVDQSDSTTIRKNFQVDAYVLPLDANNNADPSGTIATLEFQQDREATQGFRWAAWFRNDMEIFPGPQFNWNGAMHTEGSYFITNKNGFTAYMVSDPDSCLYKENASSITTPSVKANAEKKQPDYQGQFIAGEIRANSFTGSSNIHLWDGEKRPPIKPGGFGNKEDSIDPPSGKLPADLALDPVRLHTEDVSVGREVTDPSVNRDSAWKTSKFSKRLQNKDVKKPYLDDTFRADNRYGPNPTLDDTGKPLAVNIGTSIVNNSRLIDEKEGLDGYWERRARTEGLRIIVGQRLELGDPAGWGGPGTLSSPDHVASLYNEPLRPWISDKGCTGSRCNESRQRRTLWDNLAAVQATAIYHTASGDPDYPAACLATTVHPGTAGTLDKSATFENLAFGFENAFSAPYNSNDRVISDFFRGRGTNGWQYSMLPESEVSNYSSTMGKALKNLAYFAGDPLGGAPSFTPVQNIAGDGAFPHPFPSMAMWGDFSILRRIFNSKTPYASLSIADKTALHTAACMLGMLAYNVDYLNNFDYTKVDATLLGNAAAWTGLLGHIRAIDTFIYDESAAPPADGSTVLAAWRTGVQKVPNEIRGIKKDEMRDMSWVTGTATTGQKSNDPETYVRLLEFWRDATTDDPLKEQLTKEIALARLIITKEQVARDRQYGFAGSYVSKGELLFSPECQKWYDAAATAADSYKDAAAANPLMRLCSVRPRYPVLFSLFPSSNHGDLGDYTSYPGANGQQVNYMVRDQEDRNDVANFPVLATNADKNANYISGNSAAGSVNESVIYQAIDVKDIAAKPRVLGGLGFGSAWTLPTESLGDGSTPNGAVSNASVGSGTTIEKRYDLIKICPTVGNWDVIACSRAENISLNKVEKLKPVAGPLYRVPFKDSALMNGRELMSVRALNLDLDLMRLRATPFGDDFWLPKSGIIYAFREDAVSEAHIVRPQSGKVTWANCDIVSELLTSDCQMVAGVAALDSIDPPLNSKGKISPKPVDFFPDPDRRPNGFRLRNGAALWRGSVSGSKIVDAADPKGRGLSFISHNPIYVQGYFNLHRPPGNDLTRLAGWEEFEEKLNTEDFENDGTAPDGTKVYGFYNRTKLEENFADPEKDQWRPAEVLGDAVTLLSPFFCDGSIEDGLITAAFNTGDGLKDGDLKADFVADRYGCPSESDNDTSYLNQSRPNKEVKGVNEVKWMRSAVVDSYWRATLDTKGNSPLGRSESPIFIVRRGDPLYVRDTNKKAEVYPQSGNSSEGYADMFSPSNKGRRSLNKVPNGKDIQMNMILISGIIPSRAGQSYGGLHNFPRFVEDWTIDDKTSVPLYFSGAFLQLNFSTYATAPFDQEQWEPGLAPPTLGSDSNEWLAFYGAPARRWGFDVGLKYVPPGPVAERFKSPEPTRSEFYDEPAADDPYIQQLGTCARTPGSC